MWYCRWAANISAHAAINYCRYDSLPDNVTPTGLVFRDGVWSLPGCVGSLLDNSGMSVVKSVSPVSRELNVLAHIWPLVSSMHTNTAIHRSDIVFVELQAFIALENRNNSDCLQIFSVMYFIHQLLFFARVPEDSYCVVFKDIYTRIFIHLNLISFNNHNCAWLDNWEAKKITQRSSYYQCANYFNYNTKIESMIISLTQPSLDAPSL